MSGINHLYDIYNKKGQEFIDQLFNTFVTVNEKMDGSAFTFERDKNSGKFKFFRRDQRNPITLVDRTLMKYYEKPIQYIESLPPHIIERIPKGWRFGLEYFANNKPVEIVYDRVPKNNLILSYVHEYGEDGKIKKTIQDKDELDNWADLLGVERAPIIFQGHLNDDQKSKITEFLKTPFEKLVERFKTQSFVRFIIGILNPELQKSALNEDLDKNVEGIVFRFGDPNKETLDPVLAKMVDPVFTEMAKNKSLKQKENKPSDFLGLTVLDVMNFILEKGLDHFKVEGDSEDERYISFMSDVFSKFLNEYSQKYKGADFEEPEYLKKEEFRLNRDLIEDRRVLKYINEDQSFESLFKLMLNSFRKIKSRAGGIITKGMMEQINLLIRDIKDYIQKSRKGKLEEGFLSFLEFKGGIIPEVEYLKEEDSETEADENPFYSFREFITALETIDNTPSEGVPISEENKEGDLKEVNLLMGRFQPFHNGHLKMAKFLKEKNDLPSVVIVVHPGHNKSGKSPFTEDIVKKYMDALVDDEKDLEDYIIVPRGLVGSAVVKLLSKGYRPNLIGAGDDRFDDYIKQIDYIKKSDIGDQMQHLELVKTPRSNSATEVRQSIKDDDYQKFKRLVPRSVEKMYSALKSQIEGKIEESSFEEEGADLILEGEIYEILDPSVHIETIHRRLDSLKEYLNSITEDSITIEERAKLSKISDMVNRIKNLAKNSGPEEGLLRDHVTNSVFGRLGDKNSREKKSSKVDDLLQDLSDQTINNLIFRYVLKEKSPFITIEEIVNEKNGGILEIDPSQGLNGIMGKDIRKIYNFDSSIGSGLQQRGKGETLFSLAFNSVKNDLPGGDVRSLDTNKVIEIKSSNNAGITPKSSPPLSPEVEEILKTAGEIFDLTELKKGRIQKTSSLSLMDKVKNEEEGSKEFLNLLSSVTGLQNPTWEDILPIILLLQLGHYSSGTKEFKTLCVFVEKGGFPEKLIILDSDPESGSFLTEKNINTIKKSNLAPKVTSSDKVEIYMFNKKTKKNETSSH